MTTARTFGTLYEQKTANRTTTLFTDLAVYRISLFVAALDILDIFHFLQFNNFTKYGYAAVLLGLMVIYFLRWKKIDTSAAPTVLLFFFILTGFTFAIRFFIYDERNSYVSAFIAPLVFCTTLFIPRNAVMLDSRKVTRDLTILFSIGTIFYLIEAVVRPLAIFNSYNLNEVSILKSLICVLAICLFILIGRNILAFVLAAITFIALILRPTTTLVLALACCIPIAVMLRRRVLNLRIGSVFVARTIAMTAFVFAVSIPLLLYAFFDDVAPLILNLESSLKDDVIGGVSSVQFRLAILKFAFAAFDDSSFWYGSALSGNLTVPLGQHQGWQWWFQQDPNGEAPIHSDFVVVLCLMGILGYTLFSTAFYFMLRVRFRELLRRDLYGSRVVLQAISVIACVALLIYSTDEPYLAYYSNTNAVWMLLMISEMGRKAKVVG